MTRAFLEDPRLSRRLLRAADVGLVDAAAASAGLDGWTLMRRAGEAVARRVRRDAPAAFRNAPVAVLAGPGKNGGDGFVAAAALARAGWSARVHHLAPAPPAGGDAAPVGGDVASALEDWARAGGETTSLAAFAAAAAAPVIIIDALFGVGLTRALDGDAALAAETAERHRRAGRAWVVAVDVPSGLQADTGRVLGPAVAADASTTFIARRPANLLADGPQLCGAVEVVDILEDHAPARAAAEAALAAAGGPLVDLGATFGGAPEGRASLRARLAKRARSHKYDHGAVLVATGGLGATGAARLTARAALRVGAGLVTLGAPTAALAECAAQITSLMLTRIDGAADLAAALGDARISALALGPGLARGVALGGAAPHAPGAVRDLVGTALASGRAVALDADALTVFADAPATLFAAIRAAGAPVVITPHAGEFGRLFPDLDPTRDKISAAVAAAARSGATVLLKGFDSVIADPDGWAGVQDGAGARAAPWLATAGSGDVLVGMIAGLLARGASGREAAAIAAEWHLAAGRAAGAGAIAEDLPDVLPAALRELTGERSLA